MLTSIAGRCAIVTGASKGIGKGIARVFAEKGAKVMVVARQAEAVNQTVAQIKEAGGTAVGHCADVSSWEDMQGMAKAAAQKLGGVHILCCNAGIFPAATLNDMTPDQWDQVLDVNLKGTFLAVRACLEQLKQDGAGRIVVTSSVTGPITGYPGWSHYGASKAGQLGFIRTAAIELAPHHVTINAVMPGNITTEGVEELGASYIQKMAQSIPQKKLGIVEDIAYAALFFASREAGYITGQTLVVDGGQMLPESVMALEEM